MEVRVSIPYLGGKNNFFTNLAFHDRKVEDFFSEGRQYLVSQRA